MPGDSRLPAQLWAGAAARGLEEKGTVMALDTETIVVGCGCAGMNCALELQMANRPYLMITDTIGGRIDNDEKRHMNYGAVFHFGNYHNMLDPRKHIITSTTDVLPSLTAGACNDGDRQWRALSAKTAADLPSLWRYMKWMRTQFLPHYEAFKKNCETMQVSAALAADPFMDQLYHETADEMIARLGFGPICRDLVSMFAHACTGTPPQKLSALDYLNCVQPLTMELPSMKLVMSLKRFDFDSAGMKRRLGEGSGSVKMGKVILVEPEEGGWKVVCEDGSSYTAANLVLATPADVTARLLAPVPSVPEIPVRNASVLYAYYMKATIKPHYAGPIVNIFTEKTPIIFIARRNEGEYEIFTEVDFEADGGRLMNEYFDQWKIIGKRYWPQALFTNPNIVTDQNPAPGLILAGDQNGLGMEPAAISGVYAANKIMGKTVD